MSKRGTARVSTEATSTNVGLYWPTARLAENGEYKPGLEDQVDGRSMQFLRNEQEAEFLVRH